MLARHSDIRVIGAMEVPSYMDMGNPSTLSLKLESVTTVTRKRQCVTQGLCQCFMMVKPVHREVKINSPILLSKLREKQKVKKPEKQ